MGENFNTSAADGVMCKSLLSVGWDGALYDCDFNQQLGMPLRKGGRPCSIFDLESVADLSGLNIASGSHCFGCSARTRTWRRRLCLMSAWIAAAALVPTTGRDSARSGSGAALTAPRGPAKTKTRAI